MDQLFWLLFGLVTVLYLTITEGIPDMTYNKGYYLPPGPGSEGQYRYSRDHQHHDHHHDHHHPEDHSTMMLEAPKVENRMDINDEQDFPNYPYDEIRKSVEDSAWFKQYFKEIVEIGNRLGEPEELEGAESLCRTQTVRVLHPKRLKNIQDVEMIVVNDDKNFKQAIEYRKCVSDGPCTIPFDTFGYTSFCVQQYDTKKLMVFENSTKQLIFDTFKVPSCCSCMVKRN